MSKHCMHRSSDARIRAGGCEEPAAVVSPQGRRQGSGPSKLLLLGSCANIASDPAKQQAQGRDACKFAHDMLVAPVTMELRLW